MGLKGAMETALGKLAIRRLEGDKEMGPMFTKAKTFMNGKKLATGVTVLALLLPDVGQHVVEIVKGVGEVLVAFDITSPEKAAAWAAAALAGVGFIHKLVKWGASAAAALRRFGILES